MKYLPIILGIMIAVPILAYVGGSFISEQHSATVSRRLNAPQIEVWETITGVQDYAEWRNEVERVEILSDSASPLKWREYYTNNDPITFEEAGRSDSSRFVARIADKSLPFGGVWTYELEGTGSGARLTITEDGEIYNPIFRLIAKFIMGYTGTMNQYFDDLEQRLD